MKKKNLKSSIIVVQESENWLHIEALANNVVVHVFAQIVPFNWLEPYKYDVEHEQRGTGFFINAQGDIVTTAHVVDQAKRIWIQIPSLGWQTVHVELAGFCPDRDLALLKIADAEKEQIVALLQKLPCLPLGNSDDVRRTDKILVMGYPLGQYHLKMTTGIVSGREFIGNSTLLQITAPVNPGDSGGPVVNAQGQVIGIATASVLEASNIGYAIPISELEPFLQGMQQTQTPLIRKSLLGLRFNITSDDVARYLGNPVPAGAYVNAVFKNSMAERIGIQPGDMLYSCNGHTLDAYVEVTVPWSDERITFHDLLGRFNQGDSVELVWYRRGQKISKQFVFEPAPLNPIREKYPDYEPVDYEVIAGIVFMELVDNHLPLLLEEVSHLELYDHPENKYSPLIIISHILPGSAASQLMSLFPGDILGEVNDLSVNTLSSLREALRSYGSGNYLTMVMRNSNALAVFDYKQVLRDEQKLSADYGYTISPVVNDLYRMLLHDEDKEKKTGS